MTGPKRRRQLVNGASPPAGTWAHDMVTATRSPFRVASQTTRAESFTDDARRICARRAYSIHAVPPPSSPPRPPPAHVRGQSGGVEADVADLRGATLDEARAGAAGRVGRRHIRQRWFGRRGPAMTAMSDATDGVDLRQGDDLISRFVQRDRAPSESSRPRRRPRPKSRGWALCR